MIGGNTRGRGIDDVELLEPQATAEPDAVKWQKRPVAWVGRSRRRRFQTRRDRSQKTGTALPLVEVAE